MFVDADDPVKFSVLTLTNRSAASRTLSVFGYNECVGAGPRDGEHLHVVTERDEPTGAMFARNAYNQAFGGRTAFAYASDPPASFTADRRAFIGRNGDLSQAAAMSHAALSGEVGAANTWRPLS